MLTVCHQCFVFLCWLRIFVGLLFYTPVIPSEVEGSANKKRKTEIQYDELSLHIGVSV